MIDISTAVATEPPAPAPAPAPPPAPAPLPPPPAPPPPSVDLDVYYPLELSATTIARGDLLTINYSVDNHGTLQTPLSISGVYLSLDGFITTADLYLGSGPVNVMGGLAYSLADVTVQIPATLGAGTYYIGVIADYANAIFETDEGNNASTSVALTVTVPPPPPPAPPPPPPSSMDLYILQQPELSAATVVRGSTLTIHYEADHSDASGVPASVAGLYLSSDSTITADDIYLGSDDVPAMAAENWYTLESTTVTIPATLAAGTYYVGVIADYNGKINEDREANNASAGAVLTVTGTIGDDVLGTFFSETLSGTQADEAIFGMGGNDTITGGGGNDTIEGGAGLDTVIFTGSSSAFAGASPGSSLQVNGIDGRDTLVDVERLQFADGTLAFDLDGAAGTVVKLIGAVLGPAQAHDPALIGYGMTLVSDGARLAAVEQFALDYRLGPAPSHAALIDLLYTNLVGSHPSQSVIDAYSALLDSGSASDVSLTQFAMNYEYNLANIGFAGLEQTGVYFY
jgi:hypothetical protein